MKTETGIFQMTDERRLAAILALLKNVRENIKGLPKIIDRGGCLVGDKEAVDSMRIWIDEAILHSEGK